MITSLPSVWTWRKSPKWRFAGNHAVLPSTCCQQPQERHVEVQKCVHGSTAVFIISAVGSQSYSSTGFCYPSTDHLLLGLASMLHGDDTIYLLPVLMTSNHRKVVLDMSATPVLQVCVKVTALAAVDEAHRLMGFWRGTILPMPGVTESC